MNRVVIEFNGKKYRTCVPKHPCRDRRSCDLFDVCKCGIDAYVDQLPCDKMYSLIEKSGLAVHGNIAFKEVK